MTETDRALKLLNTHNVTEVHTETNKTVPISFTPNQVKFQDIRYHQKYQICVVVRNESQQIQKIRIIHPKNKYFKLNEQTCQKTIAPGLSYKLSVLFHLNEQQENQNNLYDEIIVIGKNFRKVIPLFGIVFENKIQIPQIFKIGTLKSGKEYKFQIPIKNNGEFPTTIHIQNISSPSIQASFPSFQISSGMKMNLPIKIIFKKIGIIKQSISLNSGKTILIRGICIDQKIQLCSVTGERITAKDFGYIYIGEVAEEKFCVLNNSPHFITCLTRTFSKHLFDLVNVEIDEKRGNFIIKQTPYSFTQQKQSISTRVNVEKFNVQAFSDTQFSVFLQKKPSQTQLREFSENIVEKKKSMSEIIYPHSQVTEILYFKVLKEQKVYSIPIKYTPIIPKVVISKNLIKFGTIEARSTEKKSILIKNKNDRPMKLDFEKTKNFFIEGNPFLKGFQEKEVNVCFRPLLKGKFNETIVIQIFGVWKLEIELAGKCENGKNYNIKNSIKDLKETNQSDYCLKKNFSTTTSNFLSMQRNRREDKMMKTYVKNKFEEILKNNEDTDIVPFNPLYEASQTPKINEKCLYTLRQAQSELYFKKEEYHANTTEKKSSRKLQKLNKKELSKYNTLEQKQLSLIQVLNDKIEFGHVFINSISQKQLVIRNKNEDKTILIELDLYQNESLAQTRIDIKKIQPMSQARFPINLKPMKLGYLIIPIGYIINQKYIFQIQITANVTLVNLELSTKNINFYFPENDLSFQKTVPLTIHNHGNTPTKFVFIQPITKSFQISTKGDQIMPHSSIEAQITYQPVEGSDSGNKRVQVDKIIMKVLGGAEDAIKCVGSVNQPKCTIKENEVIMGDILVSTANHSKIVLRNHSKVQSAVRVELQPLSLLENVKIQDSKKSFWILGEQKKQIPFYFLSNDVKSVKGTITICIRGGKTFKIPISASFVYPEIDIKDQDLIDFGKVPILKNLNKKEIILKNKSKCEIKLELNNFGKEIEEYFFELTAAKEENIEICKSRDGEQDELFLSSQKNTINFTSINKEMQDKNKKLNELPILKVIKLLAGEEGVFYIKFIPKLIKKYDLKVPLFLHKATKLLQPIDKRIRCEGIKPTIYINPPVIEFGNVVILESKQSYKRQIEIVNPHNKLTKWKIQTKKSLYSTFIFSIQSGQLQQNQKVTIDVYFKPIKEGKQIKKFYIYLDEEENSFSTFELEVIGNAVLPTLSFTSNYAILPVVPLSIQSRTIIEIQNQGYDTITLSKWKLSNSFQHTEMKINFIEGKLLSLAKKTLKIQICFTSEVPISFTTTLEIYDEFGQKYTIPISATAQNSVLTVYPFLQNDNNYSIVWDNNEGFIKALTCKSKTFDTNANLPGKSLMSSNFIKNWCNYELNMNIQRFPDCMIESDGEMLTQLISRVTNGKHLVKKVCFSQQKVTKTIQLYNYYNEIIRCLQIQGAFLNHIRPQFLLSTNDYLIYLTHKGMIINKEDNYEIISNQAWTILFYQICKIYIEPQINQKGVCRASRNSGKDDESGKIYGSTLYSEMEINLLNYLNSFGGEQKLFNLNENGKVLQLLQKIMQKTFDINLSEGLSKTKVTGQTLQESMLTVTKFIHSHMKQLGLSLYLQSHHLLSIGSKQLILYFISFINTISYYQTVTAVSFETSIGEKVSRAIELQNPSHKKIKYWVKLIGSENFNSDVKEVSLDPKEKRQIVITYLSKISRHETAKLVLIPMKDEEGFTSGQPLCFNLKAILITKVMVKKLNIESAVYEIVPINIQIELPISATNAEFNVSVIEENEDETQFCPSFFLISEEKRTVTYGKDKLELKFVSLELGKKYCRIVYVCPIIGEYIYELFANITDPLPLKDIKTRSIKTNREQTIELSIPKENTSLQHCINFIRQTIKANQKSKKQFWPYLFPSLKKKSKKQFKYEISLLQESEEIQLVSDTVTAEQVDKNNSLGVNFHKIQLSAFFKKPYRQYPSMIEIRNEQLKDIRVYKLLTTVIMKPKVISLNYTTRARELCKESFPIKFIPQSITFSKNVSYFSIENVGNETGKAQYIAKFKPQWIMEQQISVFAEHKDSLQQTIFKIKLIAIEPKPFKEVSVQGSQFFETEVQIDMSSFIGDHRIIEELSVKSHIKRKHDICSKYKGQKTIKITLQPYSESQCSTIRLIKPQSQQYYEIMVNIKNKEVQCLSTVNFAININQTKRYCVYQINPKQPNFQMKYKKETWLDHEIVTSNHGKQEFYFIFSPHKELSQQKYFYFSANNIEYQLIASFSVPKLPEIAYPQIITENTLSKAIVIPITNIVPFDGKYRLQIESQGSFKLDNDKMQIKKKEKFAFKVYYQPQYIGEVTKAVLTLKSDNLPQYSYLLTGYSIFKKQEQVMQFQVVSQNIITKAIDFKNQFAKKERFKFQLDPPQGEYTINGEKSLQLQIKAKDQVLFQLVCNPNLLKQGDQENTKIVITKAYDKKVIKVINLKLLLVKKFQNKTYYWSCKARQTLFQTINIVKKQNLIDVEVAPEIKKYLTFTTDEKNGGEVKIKFSPLKPIKKKKYNLIFSTLDCKYRVNCIINVTEPEIDDIIKIRTDEVHELGVVNFRLTNINKQTAFFKAYFEKGTSELQVEPISGILEPYGRIGTNICVKFTSDVYNKKIDDKLIIETQDMYWLFKVRGIQSKVLKY